MDERNQDHLFFLLEKINENLEKLVESQQDVAAQVENLAMAIAKHM